MLVSVILPVKNGHRTILKAIQSILEQSYYNLELIIINDQSTDNTLNAIYTINDKRLKIIDNSGAGIAAALNTGIKEAKGEYIARMDADDISHPMRIEKQLDFALAHPEVDIISCRVKPLGLTKKSNVGYSYYVSWINSIITAEDHYVNRFVDAPLAHPTLFCKRELFEKYGHYTEDELPEDFELWLRLMHNGLTFIKLEEELYNWTDHPKRASRVLPNYHKNKFLIVKSQYLSLWLQQHPFKEIWVWGYGKDVFNRISYLERTGVSIDGFVDVKPRTSSTRNVIHYTQVEPKSDRLYLVYISDRNGKKLIAEYLNDHSMLAGKHYLFIA